MPLHVKQINDLKRVHNEWEIFVALVRVGLKGNNEHDGGTKRAFIVHRYANRIFQSISPKWCHVCTLQQATEAQPHAHASHPICISSAISIAECIVRSYRLPRSILKIYSKTIRNSFVNWPELMRKIVWRSRSIYLHSFVSLSPRLQRDTCFSLMNSLRIRFLLLLFPLAILRSAHTIFFFVVGHFSFESMSLKRDSTQNEVRTREHYNFCDHLDFDLVDEW